jgi:hypothetical protein
MHYREPAFRGGEYKGTVYKNIPTGTGYADSIRIRPKMTQLSRQEVSIA